MYFCPPNPIKKEVDRYPTVHRPTDFHPCTICSTEQRETVSNIYMPRLVNELAAMGYSENLMIILRDALEVIPASEQLNMVSILNSNARRADGLRSISNQTMPLFCIWPANLL